MFASLLIRRPTRLAVAVLATSVFAACNNDSTAPPPEPEVQTLTLTVGTSTVTIDKTTGAASGQLVVAAGTSTVAGVWRKPTGRLKRWSRQRIRPEVRPSDARKPRLDSHRRIQWNPDNHRSCVRANHDRPGEPVPQGRATFGLGPYIITIRIRVEMGELSEGILAKAG